MMKLPIGEVAALAGGSVNGEGNVSSVVIDSRKVVPGSLYIAIKGQRFDGHAFVAEACNRGASAVMVHSDVECTVPAIKVDDTQEALLRFGGNYRDKFTPFLIGLTGSVGKTTTKDMIACALSKSKRTIKTEGNLNNTIGMTLNLLCLDDSIEAAVIEMGMNSRGEIERLSRAAKPNAALITNIGISHIGMLGSRNEILNAKMEILSGMKENAPLVINGDDDMLSTIVGKNGIKTVRYSLLGDADIVGKIVCESDNHSEVRVITANGEYEMVVPVTGRHNVYNALGAFSAALCAGVTPESAINGIADFRPMAMRQSVYEKNGVTVIEDCYNAAPDSMSAALSLLSKTGKGRRIAVFSDMAELGDYSPAAHEKVGAEAAPVADILVVFGEYASDYMRGFERAYEKKGQALVFESREELISGLKDILEEGDSVLFKASRICKLEEVIAAVFS